MQLKHLEPRFMVILLLTTQIVFAEIYAEVDGESEQKEVADHHIREKRQNGYGNGMWNNGGNFPGNWNGPNSNGYGGPQQPPPDDGIKGSIGTKEEVKPDNEQTQNGQGNQNGGYNNGPNPNGYNGGNIPPMNGYNNGQNPFGPGNGNGNGNVDNGGIKGSVGAAVEPTKAPFPNNGYGYGNRPGYGNNNFNGGYGNQGGFGFNRMSGYGNNFGRPILPRGERFFHGRKNFGY